MDKQTAEYYSSHAKGLADLYMTGPDVGVSRYFVKTFPARSSVLDIGCGTGRDMHILAGMGYNVYGIDGSAAIAAQAVETYPDLTGRVKVAQIPASDQYYGRTFDCILCSAVLMHIVNHDMFDAAFTIRNNLVLGGRLVISVPLSRPDLDRSGRTTDGRLFIIRPMVYYMLLFERMGFRLLTTYRDRDGLGRDGVEWEVAVYDKV